MATRCDQTARPGYGEMLAHEYLDTPETLAKKAAFLVGLLRSSRRAVVYSGAGISTAAGIGDYATQSEASQAKPQGEMGGGAEEEAHHRSPKSPMLAKPTAAHRALVGMYEMGLLWRWVQQNHDGLPQKAGLPQSAINEIHGALYDPSNPVVPMSGSLREDLFADLLHCAQSADLCLVLGTSLSGMNADQLCTNVAERLQARSWDPLAGPSPVYGAVIVSLQRTQCDHLASLRVFARLDDFFSLVAKHLGILPSLPDDLYRLPAFSAELSPEPDVYLVPYDQDGFLIPSSSTSPSSSSSALLRWDLREDQRVKITQGQFAGDEGEVVGANAEGHIKIRFFHTIGKSRFKAPMERTLGSWFIQAALQGQIPRLPVVPI